MIGAPFPCIEHSLKIDKESDRYDLFEADMCYISIFMFDISTSLV